MTSTTIIPAQPATGLNLPISSAGNLADVPRQLWLRQAVIIGVTLLVALIGFKTYQTYANVVQTIGKDSVPSIVAAEKIRTQLALAHTEIVNAFLIKETGDAGPSRQAYKKAIDQSYDSLVEASQNITYGDDERQPILAVMTQLFEYQRIIGMANEAGMHEAAGTDVTDSRDVQLLGQADALMREHILPSVVGLDQANFKHLDAAFTEGRQTASHWLYAFIAVSLILGIILLETQFKLYANFRRLLNPAMAFGLAVFVISIIVFFWHTQSVMSEIRSAKEDAFDSVHALSKAKAIAYSANAQESVYLLLRDKAAKLNQTTLFNDAANQLFSGSIRDIGQLPSDLKLLKNQGLLGDELANITFPGEEAMAKKTLQGWLDYVRIDSQIRELEAAGKHDAAVVLCIGKQPMQSDWAFENFMQALDGTLSINQAQFDDAIARAFKHLAWLWMLLIPIFLGPVIGSVAGLQKRLAEFRD
ncbi:hypothetical protein [Solimicrobium silvestre]|uniref:Four helix bundle sensory module for signal transduction n=1 Tax=Solimicrobium silvestre TaxID=2099400 RepID=A0A2S9GT01_9BURK|nr:hypothetical protein [Solimicrobium silvestre]PRC90831.1 Four helix bundle sensory module for signal transduction [Solimicrobium silvestre]